MIVVDEGGDHLCITQPDHARFAAELLGLWRGDGLPEHPRRRELLFAVREHDNGWRETDAAPRVDPATGRPHDFLTLPDPERLALWRRGVERWAGERPWAAALIAQHALALHRRRREDPWRELLAQLRERRAELVEAAGVPARELFRDYRLLELADTLSLAACNRWPQPVRRPGLEARFTGGALRIAPFPLAGATTFQLPVRRIPARPYRGDADLGGQLAAARWTTVPVRVTP